MSEPPDAERAPAQLLGGDDHAHVVALAARREAAVLLGDREPEAPELGQALDDLLGDVQVLAVHVLGVRADLVLGEAVERLAHQLEVLAQVARPLGGGQARQHRRIALLRCRKARGRCVPAGLDAPQRFPAGHAADEVGHHVGHERRGDAGLDLSQCAVLERRPRRGHRGGGVRHVVGDHLVGVDAAARRGPMAQAWSTRRWARSTASAAPARSGAGGVVTGSDPNGSAKCPIFRPGMCGQARRPMTVTSGGSTTGSSPGSTPVSDSR